jgi:hypothetical protein
MKLLDKILIEVKKSGIVKFLAIEDGIADEDIDEDLAQAKGLQENLIGRRYAYIRLLEFAGWLPKFHASADAASKCEAFMNLTNEKPSRTPNPRV